MRAWRGVLALQLVFPVITTQQLHSIFFVILRNSVKLHKGVTFDSLARKTSFVRFRKTNSCVNIVRSALSMKKSINFGNVALRREVSERYAASIFRV